MPFGIAGGLELMQTGVPEFTSCFIAAGKEVFGEGQPSLDKENKLIDIVPRINK